MNVIPTTSPKPDPTATEATRRRYQRLSVIYNLLEGMAERRYHPWREKLWYRIIDELAGIPYHVQALHLPSMPFEEWAPIKPEMALEDKHIEVNLGAQTLTAYESDQALFQTNISSGIATAQQNPQGSLNKNSHR